ncbi:MAG: histidine kinase [Sphingobacteriaceae bacterium]|nr:MAG: histidine kinase [Sphingobacteriaceae bacterium]
MLRVKSYIILIHLAAWLLFIVFPLLFLNNHGQNTDQFVLLSQPYYWSFCLTYILLFYVNANLLIPFLLLKKRNYDYTLAFILLLTVICFLQPYDKLLMSSEKGFNTTAQPLPGAPPNDFGYPGDGHEPPPHDFPPPLSEAKPGEMRLGSRPEPPRRRHLDSISVFLFLIIMAISTAIKLIRQWQLTDQRAVRAEADKASSELSFLKAQINPHFLFNTLNNIYTLAMMNDEHTAESIMKLSNIMRYVTDEVTANFVPLENDINCIRDYIELQKLRLGDSTTVNFAVHGTPAGKTITPLLLMTFIENVFKHGVSKNTHSTIDIDIDIDISPASISFTCKNQIFINRNETSRTGIGLENTRHRLNHLYAGKHLLNITEQDGFYTVYLNILS